MLKIIVHLMKLQFQMELNSVIIKAIKSKHKVSQGFVYLAIKDQRQSPLALEIKADYLNLQEKITSSIAETIRDHKKVTS